MFRKPKSTTTTAFKQRFSSLQRHLFSTLSLPSSAPPHQHHPTEKPLTKPDLKSLVYAHCNRGFFHNLLQNVVASPPVLLAACHNLRANASAGDSNQPESITLDFVSTHYFCLQELASQLAHQRFDVKACCFTMPPSTLRGKSLVVPNLRLKVVIEAIRMVLEIVYDDHFATFAYGGRANVGRLTAMKYVKYSVENPSWWFTVSFTREEFNCKHVNKLCSLVEAKIKDNYLIDVIKRLFECEAVSFELGGCSIGRGFPQESGLCPILMNIYFDGLDKEIQELRLLTNKKNPTFEGDELVCGSSGGAQYRPLKIYAVRYVDEILLVTSGTKTMAMNLKSKVVDYLQNKLDLSVDIGKTVIHSAVSEKIHFMGMELRAVTPSVLYPPMSEKAKRAKKKYLRQKEVRAQELRNARQTKRKKLGMKIINHVFKKLKRSNEGFKFGFQIEEEVSRIFKIWAEEVFQNFMESVDQRWEWHQKLSAGDFLSLRRIRDQLPKDLVDAYDDFQEQVDKYLNPVKAKQELEEEERRAEEEHERLYTERIVKDLTKLWIKIDAPIELIREAVRLVGFTNYMGRPRPLSFLMVLEDADIIKWYAGIGIRWLRFYSLCHNFRMVKTVVTYHLRFSCLLTLAEKHESTKHQAISHFTKDLRIFDINGSEEFYFPTEREIKLMKETIFLDAKPADGSLSMCLTRLASDEPSYRCVAHFCDRIDTTVYRIRLLQNHFNLSPSDNKKWVSGLGSIHESFNWKCLPLCPDHISELYMGRLTLQDVDCATFVDLDQMKSI